MGMNQTPQTEVSIERKKWTRGEGSLAFHVSPPYSSREVIFPRKVLIFQLQHTWLSVVVSKNIRGKRVEALYFEEKAYCIAAAWGAREEWIIPWRRRLEDERESAVQQTRRRGETARIHEGREEEDSRKFRPSDQQPSPNKKKLKIKNKYFIILNNLLYDIIN